MITADAASALDADREYERYFNRRVSRTRAVAITAVGALLVVFGLSWFTSTPMPSGQTLSDLKNKNKVKSTKGSSTSTSDPLDVPSVHENLMKRGLEHLSIKSEEEKRGMFETFKKRHSKKYKSDEEHEQRFQIWDYNLRKVDALNSVQERVTYGITALHDFTWEEFESYTNLKFDSFSLAVHSGSEDGSSKDAKKRGYVPYESVKAKGRKLGGHNKSKSSSGGFNWADQGMVTPVRKQGTCGDCWAIAATEDIEGTWAMSQGLGKAIELSEQQIAACDSNAAGCQGGVLSSAYEYVINAGGVVSEKELPYSEQAFDGNMPSCPNSMLSSGNFAAHISSWTQIKPESVDDVKEELQDKGPMAVAINAYQMQFYHGGVDTASFCSRAAPNHAVLLVGWGEENGEEYWIIKNSWGSYWGENGYYRLSTAYGACGLYTMIQTSLA
uniref:Uncharacterized protein n=1 Tax=Fibrocapsa japonica TaxID=94617 RepID=A0A7S2V8V4_9STRA